MFSCLPDSMKFMRWSVPAKSVSTLALSIDLYFWSSRRASLMVPPTASNVSATFSFFSTMGLLTMLSFPPFRLLAFAMALKKVSVESGVASTTS